MENTHNQNNRTADHHSENEDNSAPETVIIINCVLNAPLMLISILGNALVLAAIIRTPSIRSTPHLIMLSSLAVSDFLVGLIAQPIYIVERLTKDRFVDHVARMIGYSLCGVSLLTITTITVDRFLALHYHMRYATLVTESRVKYTLVIVWLVSFLISGFYTFFSSRALDFLLGFLTIICLIISTFFYIMIYRIVCRHQSQIHAQQQAVQSSDAENNLNITRLKKKCFVHFRLLHSFDYMLFSAVCYIYSLWTLHKGLANKMGVCLYRSVYELIDQSNFVLLASSRASRGSCKDSKANVM